MVTLRPAGERGRTRFDWLDSRHTFSFADYFDRRHIRFGPLRVLNEDVVAPDSGFPWHPHRDMEILTLVLAGAIEHGDDLGNRFVLRPGEVQRMTAGTGIVHREWNPDPAEPVHLLQIWIEPERLGLAPGYEQREISGELVASRDGRDGSVRLHQDANVYVLRLERGKPFHRDLGPARGAWIQGIRGRATVGDTALGPGDGVAVRNEPGIEVVAGEEAELVFFDLPRSGEHPTHAGTGEKR